MASLFRPTYTDRKTGKSRKAKKYYGQYVDADGITRRVPLSTNKTAAEQMLNALVRKAELGRVGVHDRFEDHRKRPLSVHRDEWEASLRANSRGEEYIKLKLTRLNAILESCSFKFLVDLSADKLELFLARLRDEDDLSIQTANDYLQAAKQFTRWLVANDRFERNPFLRLQGGNVKLDRRHNRRDISEEELTRLFEWVRQASRRAKLTGIDREMLYLVSAYTGLRASELASLKPDSFDLDAATPTVTVEAGYSKHRREDILPLHADLVNRLRQWLIGKPRGESVWPGPWAANKAAGKMLQADLKKARAEWIAESRTDAERKARIASSFLVYRDADNRVADFHSLRHTFITRLIRSGAKPKEAQTLARHSTIKLTMDRYTHTGLHDVAAAVEGLPRIPSTGPETGRQILKATGTDGDSACTVACTKLAQTTDSSPFRLITDDSVNVNEADEADLRIHARNQGILSDCARKEAERAGNSVSVR